MARKEISTKWDRVNRNNMNDNFKELYDATRNFVEEISEEVIDKVIDGSKLVWKEPVDSQSDLPSSASEGDTRMARDTGKVYRFDGSEWKEIQQIDSSPINEIDDRLSSQLADTNQKVDNNHDEVTYQLAQTDQKVVNIETKINPFDADIPDNESISAFINAMNEKANELGMDSTNFVNPSGLYNENQVTTAKDMLLMGINALGYKDLVKAWSREEKSVVVKGDNPRSLSLESTIQKTSMNDNYHVTGGKTGTLSAHDVKNLMSVVNSKYSNNWFIGCVLEATSSRYTASRQLFDIANTSLKHNTPIEQHTSNLSNGNFDEGMEFWSINEGNPTITKEDYYSFPQSLKVDSTGSSSQVRRSPRWTVGNQYYVCAMVKCKRYSSGRIGLLVSSTSPSTNITVERTTDGWELVSGIIEPTSTSGSIYAGGISSADLDGYVDAINVINLTSEYGEGNEPSKNEMDSKIWRDVDSNMAISCQIPNAFNSFNVDNLPVLFEKNSNEITYPGSLAKVMTSMIMLDNIQNLKQEITINTGDISGGSGPTFYSGDKITWQDALYCMMLPSSNTIANAVARLIGKKIIVDNY